MATSTWDSGVSADWDVAADWSPAAPGGSSTVAITAPGAYDISIAQTETVSIASLALTAAELTVNGNLTLDNAADTSVIGPVATLQSVTPNASSWTFYDDGTLLNQGTIFLGGTGYMANFAQVLDNTGAVIALGGGEILLEGQTLVNLSNGTLIGGSYSALGVDSQIDLRTSAAAPTTLVADDADITLAGFGSDLIGFDYNAGASTAVALEATLATIAAAGVLNVTGTRDYAAAVALTDAGLLTLGGGSLSAPGLIVAAGGTLAGFGTVVTPVAGSGLVVAQGGTLVLAGGVSGHATLVVGAGTALQTSGTQSGALVTGGTVIVSGSRLDVTGAVSGTGGFLVAGGSVGRQSILELASPVSNGITFGGDFATVRLDTPQSFAGTIAQFGAGDTFDLAGVAANGATLVGTTLDLTNNGSYAYGLQVTGAGAGLTYSALPDGTGGAAVTATGPGLTINFIYDSSVAAAPPQFEQALTIAADNLQALIKNPITVDIEVGWGEIDGDSSGFADDDGEGGPASGLYLPYSQFKADFIANESDAADVIAGAHLPATDPTNGTGVFLSYSQEKAWGLLPENDSEVDGSVGFSATETWNFGTTWTPDQYNDVDFIGVAEHELTHAMGRVPGTNLDLFRYTAPGVFEPNETGPAYFSIDGGTTDLAAFDTLYDPSDWNQSEFNDSFSVDDDRGVPHPVSGVDNQLMSVLGFDDVACFAAGTCLATERGAVAVEHLRVGERVTTRVAGAPREIIWIGTRRVNCRRHNHPEQVWPVRIRRWAFGRGRPKRDLLLSPDHAVLVDGVLIPIRYLINGGSIAQDQVDHVTYWHIELASHDVILAEGLACETYLDTGNRSAFDNAGVPVALHPDFSRQVWEARGCARLLSGGRQVAAVKRRLIDRLVLLGYRLTDCPGIRFLVDGYPVPAIAQDECFVIALPKRAKTLAIVSRVARPADLDPQATDPRRLGVALLSLCWDGTAVSRTDKRLTTGWYPDEDGFRWTDGTGLIDVGGHREVALRATSWMRYLAEPAQRPEPDRADGPASAMSSSPASRPLPPRLSI